MIKQHLVVWTIAFIMALLAVGVYLSRQAGNRLPRDADAVATRALSLLEADVNALRTDTQNAIRAAAVLAEEGEILSARGAYLLGRQYEREQNFNAAEGLFKKAIALDPSWSVPYTSLGNLLGLHSFGRLEEAREVLHKAIAMDPAPGRAHGILAIIFRAEGRYDEALEQFELALKYMPNDISPLNNYANLLVDLNRYDEAEVYFRRAIASFPEHPKPYYNLACLFALNGRDAEALDYLKEAFSRSDALRYEALSDPDLASLEGDPAFEKLVYRGNPPEKDTPPDA